MFSDDLQQLLSIPLDLRLLPSLPTSPVPQLHHKPSLSLIQLLINNAHNPLPIILKITIKLIQNILHLPLLHFDHTITLIL